MGSQNILRPDFLLLPCSPDVFWKTILGYSPPLASFSPVSFEVGEVDDQGYKFLHKHILSFPGFSLLGGLCTAPCSPRTLAFPTPYEPHLHPPKPWVPPVPTPGPGNVWQQLPSPRSGLAFPMSALLRLPSLQSPSCPPLPFAFLLFATLPLHPSPLYPSLFTSPFAPLSLTSLPFASLPPSHLPFPIPPLYICAPRISAPVHSLPLDPLYLHPFAPLPTWLSALWA